jgi:hypothetical protein
MRHRSDIRTRLCEGHSPSIRPEPTERGTLLLLHVDGPGASPQHTIILVVSPPDTREADLAPGCPLPDHPELTVARVWRNASAMDARRMTRYPNVVSCLCPMCTPELIGATDQLGPR